MSFLCETLPRFLVKIERQWQGNGYEVGMCNNTRLTFEHHSISGFSIDILCIVLH